MTDAVPFARLKLSHALAIFRLALILCELQLANPITICIIINELKRTRNIRIYICLRDIAAASPHEAEHVSQFLGRKRERYIALLLQPQSEFGDCQHVGLRRWRAVAGGDWQRGGAPDLPRGGDAAEGRGKALFLEVGQRFFGGAFRGDPLGAADGARGEGGYRQADPPRGRISGRNKEDKFGVQGGPGAAQREAGEVEGVLEQKYGSLCG